MHIKNQPYISIFSEKIEKKDKNSNDKNSHEGVAQKLNFKRAKQVKPSTSSSVILTTINKTTARNHK